MQRSFSSFPAGWPGAGLLLLRVAVGFTAVMQSWLWLAEREQRTLLLWSIGLLALISGVALLIGYFTPVAGVLAGLGSLGFALSWFAAPGPHLFDQKLAAIFVAIMSAALVFLGPGAFSLDSRLFGRREVFIPPAARAPKA
ncbi:MAG: hypothetical protein HYR56_20335 [Acidobacteria bacterium]|nr:hypothetical protein [Acidobacteriota bacterium]MBI3427659.1 hypothetical protein [Acidobacteriota bacterium]